MIYNYRHFAATNDHLKHHKRCPNPALRKTSNVYVLSVRSRGREGGRRKPDALARSVEHGVEALHEEVAVDEVEAGAALAADLLVVSASSSYTPHNDRDRKRRKEGEKEGKKGRREKRYAHQRRRGTHCRCPRRSQN